MLQISVLVQIRLLLEGHFPGLRVGLAIGLGPGHASADGRHGVVDAHAVVHRTRLVLEWRELRELRVDLKVLFVVSA